MKKTKIIFWATTALIFLTQGVAEALTFRTPMAITGVTHLGYPVYFLNLLVAFKTVGALVLIIPQVPARIKEWAYVGFGIDFTSAFVSIMVIDGFGFGAVLPLICLIVLYFSYTSYHKLQTSRAA